MNNRSNLRVGMRCASLACGIFILLSYISIHTSPVAAESPAFIRVVHASPDVGTVDVFMDGTKLLSSFQYATVSNYLPLPSGAHDIKVALIGKGADAAVVTQTLQVITGKVYTIAAVGMQSNKSLALEVFEDNNAVSGNTAKVRIYHLSPGTGTVDVSEDARKVIQNVSYEHASDYLSVPAGTYTFNATITPANATIPISAELKPWTVTSLFAIGLLNNDPQLKFVSSQTTGTPGMPQTGSAPVVSVNVSQSLLIWSVALLVLLLTIVSCGVYYRVSGIFNTKK